MTTINSATTGSTDGSVDITISGCDSCDIDTNALILSGALAVTHDQNVTYCDADGTFVFNEETCDRLLGHDLLNPSWYIRVTTDISQINFCDSHGTDYNDDAWGITGTTWNKTGADAGTSYTAEYKLPNATVSNIKLAEYGVTNEDGDRNITYHLMAHVTLSDDGSLSNTLDVVDAGESVGGSFTCDVHTITEDVNKAQVAYFDGDVCDANVAAPGPNDADSLTATLTEAQICDDRSAKLAQVASDLSTNIISSWTITLNSAPLDTASNLSKFARARGKTDKNVFSNDDLVVMDTPKLYTVQMDDHSSTTYTIANDYVYGVLKHSA
jgi:hypothetical protein